MARRYFYPGCHRMQPYSSMNPDAWHHLPQTERISARVLVLPTGETVSPEDIRRVCSIIRVAVEHAGGVDGAARRRGRSSHRRPGALTPFSLSDFICAGFSGSLTGPTPTSICAAWNRGSRGSSCNGGPTSARRIARPAIIWRIPVSASPTNPRPPISRSRAPSRRSTCSSTARSTTTKRCAPGCRISPLPLRLTPKSCSGSTRPTDHRRSTFSTGCSRWQFSTCVIAASSWRATPSARSRCISQPAASSWRSRPMRA